LLYDYTPFSTLMLFFIFVPKNYKWYLLGIVAFYFYEIDQRNDMAKVLAACGIGFVISYCYNIIPKWSIKLTHLTFLIAPFVLIWATMSLSAPPSISPVDILTQLAVVRLGLPWKQVLGLGTMLDTARFRSLLADELKLAPTQVKALILGEHGDTMLPIWSSATAAGLPLDKFPGVTASFQAQLFERTKGSGAEVIRRKGGAGWAVGLTIAEVVHCIALDRRQLLPVSSVQQGKYGLRDIAISVPTIVGRSGVIEQVELSLWPKEQQGLQASARALQEIWSKVKPKN